MFALDFGIQESSFSIASFVSFLFLFVFIYFPFISYPAILPFNYRIFLVRITFTFLLFFQFYSFLYFVFLFYFILLQSPYTKYSN